MKPIARKSKNKKTKDIRELIRKEYVDLKGIQFPDGDYLYWQFYMFDFSNANLKRVNFRQTVLEKVKFIGADLSEADFTEATFKDVDFTDANLYKTKFNSIRIEGEFKIWKAKNPREIVADEAGFKEIIDHLKLQAQEEPDEIERNHIEELCKFYEKQLKG